MLRTFAILLLAGLAAAPLLASEPPLAETCPNLTKAEIRAIENYKGQFRENAYYARAYCVSVEEAERRMAIQLRDAVGPKQEPGAPPAPRADGPGQLGALLREREAATFAGLWIEHRPTYRVVVAFTRDAAATLARYTRDPLFVPLDRPGPSYRELQDIQQRLIAEFQRRGIRWAMAGANEQTGRIDFELAQQAAPIRAAAARGEFDLPPFVVLNEPRPLPHPAPPPPRAGDTRVKAFPQLKHRTDMFPQTLVGVPDVAATLELRNGCLVFVTDTDTRTALWGAEDAVDLSDPSQVTIVDRLSGKRITVGERVSLAGLQPSEPGARDKAAKVGESPACPGPYRHVGGFLPMAEYAAQRKEQRILSLINHDRLSRAAAERRYAAERARIPQLHALRARLLAEYPELIGAFGVNETDATAHVYLLPAARRDALIPAALRPYVTSQPAVRSGRELEAEKARVEAELAAADITARVAPEVSGGHLYIETDDPRALSAALVAGKVRLPDWARAQLPGAMPIGGYTGGLTLDQVMQRYEQRPGFNALRERIARTPLPGYTDPNTNKRPVALPSRARSLDYAHWLSAFGHDDPALIERLKSHGVDVIATWADQQTGPTSHRHRAIVAEQVVLAQPVAVDTRAHGKDGMRSTITWRVVESLKGGARPGDHLRQRLSGGEDKDGGFVTGTDEPILLPGFPTSLEPNATYLLHLSSGLYRHQSLLYGGDGAAQPGMTVGWQAPARIRNGRFLPTPESTELIALDAFRAEVAPVQKAFVNAGAYSSR